MKKLVTGIFLFLLSFSAAFAVPAYPGLIRETYPDGTAVSYYIRGDEYFSYKITEDGYLLASNADGVLEYGRLNARNMIEPTGVKATEIAMRSPEEVDYLHIAYTEKMLQDDLRALHAIAKSKASAGSRSAVQRAYPLKDSPKSLVILANFKNKKFTSPTAKDDFDAMLNQDGYAVGGSLGSARDYFRTASSGVFSPEFVVVGPVELPRDFEFYGEDYQGSHDRYAAQMILDACKAADEAGLDFSVFDTDKNGVLDNVFVFFAGGNQADGSGNENTVWPHRSVIVNSGLELDGVSLRDYACTSEMARKGQKIEMCGIGTFCHEFGHVLGLADLYDTDYSGHATVGRWDIMDNGSYANDGMTPPTYSSFERFYLGWLKPVQLDIEGDYFLDPLITHNTAYIVSSSKHNLNPSSPSPREYFLLENRQAIDMDANGAVPATGLLIWHINFNLSNWNNNRPNNDKDNMGVMVYTASSSTGYPAANVFPGSSNKTTCEFVLRDGTKLPSPLFSIADENNVISFSYGNDPNAPYIAPAEPIGDFVSYFGEKNEIKTVEFIGRNVTGNVRMSVLKVHKSDFKIRLHTDDNSQKFGSEVNVSANDEDSTLNCKIDILFEPSELTYDLFLTDQLIISSGRYQTRVNLRGQSQRPVKVVPPVAYDAENVETWSYRALWSRVEDATGYYLTSYTIDNKESSEVENFTGFDKGIPGWTANFSTVSSQNKSSAPYAVSFTSSGDTLWTKEFFMPVSKLSFWFQSVRSQGELFVDAKEADGSWTNVYAQVCERTTVKTATIELDSDSEYREFRIYYSMSTDDGSLAFDDFITYYSKHLIYQLQDHFVEAADTSYVVPNLSPNTLYRYSVRATDKDLEEGKYENITSPSNEIEVTTIAPAGNIKERSLVIVGSKETRTYRAYVDAYEEGMSLFIYTLNGELVAEIPATSNEFLIPELTNGVTYVLKYAKKGDMKRKTRVGKLIYGMF